MTNTLSLWEVSYETLVNDSGNVKTGLLTPFRCENNTPMIISPERLKLKDWFVGQSYATIALHDMKTPHLPSARIGPIVNCISLFKSWNPMI
jgi:hypothetical protein